MCERERECVSESRRVIVGNSVSGREIECKRDRVCVRECV